MLSGEGGIKLIESNESSLVTKQIYSANATSLPSVRLVKGHCESPTYIPDLAIRSNRHLIYCENGTGLIHFNRHGKFFMGPRSVALISPGSEWTLLQGRGSQSWLVSSWLPGNPAIPDEDIGPDHVFLLSPGSIAVTNLTERAICRVTEVRDWPNFLLAWFNLVLHERHLTNSTFSLTPGFQRGAEQIGDLVSAIKAAPQRPWNLTDASALAGYSPFHLSRIFRHIAKMGFPEFVDRCRVEVMMKVLLETNTPLTTVAEQCGFGTPQAMRNACRSYAGFLPSELRDRGSE